MNTLFGIANYFIYKARESEDITEINLTPIKLIKLVFIAHGTYLATKGKILFKEPVQAWKYGPIIPDLYHMIKDYRGDKIVSYIGLSKISDDGSVAPNLPTDPEILELLEEVWKYFGSWTGIELSSWTHRQGSAWDIAYNKLGADKNHKFLIDPLLIKDEFKNCLL